MATKQRPQTGSLSSSTTLSAADLAYLQPVNEIIKDTEMAMLRTGKDGSTKLIRNSQLPSKQGASDGMEIAGMKGFGMESDLTVHFDPNFDFPVHKFPLYCKTDFLSRIAALDTNTGKTRVDLSDLPGGKEAFKLVAAFCYTANVDIDARNVAPLLCAAMHLEMFDASSSGASREGNLASIASNSLGRILETKWQDAFAILKSCEELPPHAQYAGIVGQCIDAITDGGIQNPEEKIHMSEVFLSLRSDFYLRLIEGFKRKGLLEEEINHSMELYGRRLLPNIQDIKNDRQSVNPSQLQQWRVLVEKLVELLPANTNSLTMEYFIHLYKAATSIETTTECREKLESQIAEQFNRASVEDLLRLNVDEIISFLSKFVTPKSIEEMSNSGAMHEAANLIDRYLKELSSRDKTLSMETFESLVQKIPDSARLLHDNLYYAVHAYILKHKESPNKEKFMELIDLITTEKLSDKCLEAASSESVWPITFTVELLRTHKQRLAEHFAEAVKKEEAMNSILSTVGEEAKRLHKENAELKQKVTVADASANTVRVMLREEILSVSEELNKEKLWNNDLQNEVKKLERILDAQTSSAFGCLPIYRPTNKSAKLQMITPRRQTAHA